MKDNTLAIQQPSQEPSVALMLQTFIEKGITPESVGAFSQLCELKERMDTRNAEREFNAAFHALQADLPVIVATSIIPNRGKYERYEDVMEKVGPLLKKHGFGVSFSNDYADNKITETCHLRHVGGHKESNSFTVRVGGRADSDTQADCKAATTAKRNALLNALNITIRQDALQDGDDPRNLGACITQRQADELRDLCDDTKSDRARFLAFAGAEDFEGISDNRFEELVTMLRKKLK